MHFLFAKISLNIPIVPLYWQRLTGNTFLNDYKMNDIYSKYKNIR